MEYDTSSCGTGSLSCFNSQAVLDLRYRPSTTRVCTSTSCQTSMEKVTMPGLSMNARNGPGSDVIWYHDGSSWGIMGYEVSSGNGIEQPQSLPRPLRRLGPRKWNTTGHTETPQHHLTAVYRVLLARPLPVEQVSQVTWYHTQVHLTATKSNLLTTQLMVTTSGKSRQVDGTPTRTTAHSATTTGR